MRKCLIFLLLAAALATGVCAAADVLQEEAAILGADKLEDAFPAEAEEALGITGAIPKVPETPYTPEPKGDS